ncbi:MAG: hypothetical protein R2882_13970 [Gemmatimonadales bacterium]
MPSSRRRWATLPVTTPKTPRPVMTSASPPNTEINTAFWRRPDEASSSRSAIIRSL